MVLEYVVQYASAAAPAIVAGTVLGTGGMLVRWGFKVDRSLSTVNTALENVAKTLNGHEERLASVETRKRPVARSPKRRYATTKAKKRGRSRAT